MRVCVIVGGHHFQKMGGAELQASLVARLLADRGDEVWSLAIGGRPTTDELVFVPVEHGVQLIEARRSPDDSSPSGIRNPVPLIQTLRPDVCYMRYFDGLRRVVPGCARHGIPLIAHITSEDECAWMPPWPSWRHYLPWNLQSHTANLLALSHQVPLIACQTSIQKAMLEQVSGRLKNRTIVLPNLWPRGERSDKEPIVIWVGNMRPVKRPLHFVKLASTLRGSGYRFVMVGRDDSGGRYRQRIASEGSAEMWGELPSHEASMAIARARVLVCTSKYEGFPGVFLQSFASRTAVASLGVDPDGILSRLDIGVVADNLPTLAARVRRLLDDDVARDAMLDRAEAYYEATHTLTAATGAYYDAFDRAVNPCRRAQQ